MKIILQPGIVFNFPAVIKTLKFNLLLRAVQKMEQNKAERLAVQQILL
jgi:hypothetical protein